MKKVGGGGGNSPNRPYGLGEALIGITPEEGVICCSNRFVGVISNGFWVVNPKIKHEMK